jgi:hypothetical protein
MQNYLILLYREAVGSYAENQRITAVRKVYQRGVVNPMINIEVFWKEKVVVSNVQPINHGIYLNTIESNLYVNVKDVDNFTLNRQNNKVIWNRVRAMVFNTTFNNISVISWRSVLLVEETAVPGENH